MKRIKNDDYLKWIREQSCCLCGWQSSTDRCDPHHVGDGKRSRRSDDRAAVPLCRKCHSIVHTCPAAYRDKLRELAAKYWERYLKEKS